MSGGGLWDLAVLLGLNGVDQIGELDGVLDEENGDVVSNDIYGGRLARSYNLKQDTQDLTKVSFIGVETGCETVNISSQVGATAATSNGGESDKDRRFLSFSREE